MFDEGYVIDSNTTVTAGCVTVFTTNLEVEDLMFASGVEELAADVVTGMFVCVVQFTVVMNVFFVALGVDIVVHGAADDGLWFVAFGDGDCEESMFAGGHPCIAADEVHVVGALHQQLSHECIVVIVSGQMAVRAGFSFAFSANCVGNVGAEGNTAETFGGDCLLLCVDGFAIEVVRSDMDSAGGA